MNYPSTHQWYHWGKMPLQHMHCSKKLPNNDFCTLGNIPPNVGWLQSKHSAGLTIEPGRWTLNLTKQWDQLPIGQSFTYRQQRMKGRYPGFQRAAVSQHAVPVAGSRKALMESRGNYSCWALWSQGHMLHLQGHHETIQGKARTYTLLLKRRCFSFPYHIRHMVCQRKGTRSAALMSWLGVFRPQTLLNQWLPFEFSNRANRIYLLPSVNSNHTQPPDCSGLLCQKLLLKKKIPK